MTPTNTTTNLKSDRALATFSDAITLEEMDMTVATCVANLHDSIDSAREAAVEWMQEEDEQAAEYLRVYADALEQKCNWLARWWKDHDYDESVTVSEALLGWQLFSTKTDLIKGNLPGASEEAREAAENALAWVTSDYAGHPGEGNAWLKAWLQTPHAELGGAMPAEVLHTAAGRRKVERLLDQLPPPPPAVSFIRVARALGIDVDALRYRLLSEAGLKEEASWYGDSASVSAPERRTWETVPEDHDAQQKEQKRDRVRKAPVKGADIRGAHAFGRRSALPQATVEAIAAVKKAAAPVQRLDLILAGAVETIKEVKDAVVSTAIDLVAVVRHVAGAVRVQAARQFKRAKRGVAAAAAMLLASFGASADGPVKHDLRTGVEASNNVSLSTYVLQAATFLQPRTEQEKEVKQCVAKLTDLSPGGGDAFSQQRAVSSEIALSQIMMRGLEAAKNDTTAAEECHWHLSNLPIKLQDPQGEVYVSRSGQAASPSFREQASDRVGRQLICASALGGVSRGVLEELKASPMTSEAQAVEVARRHIARDLRAEATRVYQADRKILATPVLMADGNAGSTKPFAPVSRGGLLVAKSPVGSDEKDGAKYVGDQVSSLAQQTMDISAIAVGGFLSWTTLRTDGGLAAKYDGSTFSVSRNGMPLFDATTIDGATSRVSIAANGSFTSASPQLAGRTEQLAELSTCALAMNNVAQQLTPRLLKPKMVPPASSKATQTLLHKADFAQALAQARSVTTSGELQTDYSDGGMRWRVGAFGFAKNGGASRSGVQVTLGGAVYFDDTHIAGQSYTVNASASDSSSTGYFAN